MSKATFWNCFWWKKGWTTSSIKWLHALVTSFPYRRPHYNGEENFLDSTSLLKRLLIKVILIFPKTGSRLMGL